MAFGPKVSSVDSDRGLSQAARARAASVSNAFANSRIEGSASAHPCAAWVALITEDGAPGDSERRKALAGASEDMSAEPELFGYFAQGVIV